LKNAEEKELDETDQSKELRLMKEYLEAHVAKKRDDIEKLKIPEVERIKKSKSLENEEELIHVAIGAKNLGFEVSYDDYNNVLDDIFGQHHKHEIASDVNKFARYLRYANVKLNDVPFYPMRKQELDGTKNRAVMLNNELDNPSMLGRLQELEKFRWRSSLSTINSYYDDEDIRRSRSIDKLSNSSNNNEGRGGSDELRSLALSQSLPSLPTSPEKGLPKRSRNLLLNAPKGQSIDSSSPSVNSAALDGLESTTSSKSTSPEKRKAMKALKIFNQQQGASDNRPMSATSSTSSASKISAARLKVKSS